MILYAWIESYRSLKNIGFNLSSRYHFDFSEGKLTMNEVDNCSFFDPYINDLKAIIGKNGTGKSSMIFTVLDSILSNLPQAMNGFVVTDKYILNRRGIAITHNISVEGLLLKEVTNASIANHNKQEWEKELTENEAASYTGNSIINTMLDDHSLLYYSPLLNYDRIYEGEGVVAGNRAYEVDYDRYVDISTEHMLIFDSNNFTQFDSSELRAESELLCHKALESQRILQYLIESKDSLPINLRIPTVTIRLNQFALNYWEAISRFFKSDSEIEGPLVSLIRKVNSTPKLGNRWEEFEDGMYERFLYEALRYEVHERNNFGQYGEMNALTYTMDFFQHISRRQKTIKGMLKNYLRRSEIFTNKFDSLFEQIDSFVKFIKSYYKKKKITAWAYEIEIAFGETQFFKDFLEKANNFFGIKNDIDGEHKMGIHFPIFSFDFSGLSAGEKSLLHMLSRLHHFIKPMRAERKEIIVFLDEPDVGLHPQWQKQLITILCHFFQSEAKGRRVQLIMTGHSPIIISDLPEENVVFLDIDKESNKPFVSALAFTGNTFAANIHALYADAFFIQHGTIGDFAKSIIERVVKALKENDESQRIFTLNVITRIGDPLVRQRLEDIWQKTFGQIDENLLEKKARLENELAKINQQIDENN